MDGIVVEVEIPVVVMKMVAIQMSNCSNSNGSNFNPEALSQLKGFNV